MSAGRTSGAELIFDVPGGRLVLAAGHLDAWAEHLTWCYRFLGVADGATVAVQDFGASPLSFLGSNLLMPGLEAGVAERLGGRVICLDASPERVTLTPAVIGQVRPDVLVVRAEVAGLLEEAARQRGIDLAGEGRSVIVAGDGARPWPEARARLLHVERALLLAPGCAACGCFHLRAGLYEVEKGAVANLRHPAAEAFALPRGWREEPGWCSAGMGDRLIRSAAGDS